MKYEKRSDRKRRLKEIAEKKTVKEEKGVKDTNIVRNCFAGFVDVCICNPIVALKVSLNNNYVFTVVSYLN